MDYSHAASKAKKSRRQVYNHDADASDPFRYYTIPVPIASFESTFCPPGAIPRAPPPSPILLHPSCSTLGAYFGFEGPDEFAAVLLARLQGLFNAQQEKLVKQEELERQHWDRANAESWADYFNLDYEG